MIEGYCIEAGALRDAPVEQASVWLCIAPDTGEQRLLRQRLGIGAQALESSLDPDEVARIEIKPSDQCFYRKLATKPGAHR